MATEFPSVVSGCRTRQALRASLAEGFRATFLPLPITSQEAAQISQSDDIGPTWTGRSGYSLLFVPPPEPVSLDPRQKPDRLRLVNARLKELRRSPFTEKMAVAYETIDALLATTDRAAVAFSGGRDSLVALHMTLQRRPDVNVVFTNTGIEFPETLAYVRQLADAWHLNFHELKVQRNFWELARERGLPIGGRGNGFFLRDLSQASGVKLSNACCNQLKITPARQFYRRTGIEAVVTGLRTEESLMRRLNFADYGALRWSKDYGAMVAWPLYAWSKEDIGTYIAEHNLPVNSLYGKGHDRVGCWACLQDFLHEDSRMFVLQKTHPGMYATLKKQFGGSLLRVLLAWGHVKPRNFSVDEHFDGLYRPCGLEMLRPHSQGRARRQPMHDDKQQAPGNPRDDRPVGTAVDS